jgi:thiol-disulfide isomerase/thioredoxin
MVAGYYTISALVHRRAGVEPVGAQRLTDFAPISIGRRVTLPVFGRSPDTYAFVLVLSPDCPHCVAAAPLLRALTEQAARQGVRIVLALPDKAKDKAYAATLGARGTSTVDWVELGLKPLGTPMIILVDAGGTVVKYWLGEPSSATQHELINAVAHPSDVANYPRRLASGQPMFTESDLRATSGPDSITIVNLLERPQFKGTRYDYPAVNIPLDELRFRSLQELNPAKTQVIDCTVVATMVCDNAVKELRMKGFRAVAMDNSGSGECPDSAKNDGQ